MKIHLNAPMCFQSFLRKGWLALTTLVLLTATSTTADAQDLTTQIYPLDAYLSSPLSDQSTDHQPLFRGGGQGGGGGGGFGGGGGAGLGNGMEMGGGGAFRIPDNILPQFGLGGGGPVNTRSTSVIYAHDILDLIEVHLPKSIAETTTLSVLGSSMWATTTQPGHQAIEQILRTLSEAQNKSRSIQVDIRMVTLTPEASVAFTKAIGDKAKQAAIGIAELPGTAKVSVRCDNYEIASISSGIKRSYVVNATPVVGGDSPSRSIGYQPQTEEILLGLTGRVRPRADEKGVQGRIDVSIQLTSGPEPEEIAAANYTDGGIIDRVELEVSTLSTTITAPANQWTLAGVTALTDPASPLTGGAALSHMVTVIRWMEVK